MASRPRTGRTRHPQGATAAVLASGAKVTVTRSRKKHARSRRWQRARELLARYADAYTPERGMPTPRSSAPTTCTSSDGQTLDLAGVHQGAEWFRPGRIAEDWEAMDEGHLRRQLGGTS